MAEKNVILKNSIGDVLYPKIADNSVTTNKIVDKAVTTNKIDNNAITEDKIASSAVTTSKIADGTITKEKLDNKFLHEVLVDVTSVTWYELKQLRDGNNLIPGHQYRITDYQCTTTQENTQSAGHQFDIIVTADGIDKLNEKARACPNISSINTYFKDSNLAAWQLWYCLDNDTNRFAWARANDKKYTLLQGKRPLKPGVVYYKYVYTIYGDGTKVTYDNKDYYSFSYLEASDSNKKIFIPTEIPKVGDIAMFMTKDSSGNYIKDELPDDDEWNPGGTFNNITIEKIEEDEFGHGVIYRMIDEFNNDCPYDFKNIQFKRYKITSSNSSSLEGTYLATKAISDIGLEIDNNDSKMFYTFSYLGKLDEQSAYKGEVLKDASIIGNTLELKTDDNPYGVRNNNIKYYFTTSDSGPVQTLNNIVFLTYRSTTYYSCYSNSFDVNCSNISFGRYCSNNSFGNTCSDISFGNGCHNNLFGAECYSISFDGGIYNSFSTNCFKISFGSGCNENSFGRNCLYISLGNNCSNISLGNDCTDSSLGNDCSNISLGTECNHITLGNYYRLNTFDNGVSYVTFDGDGTESNHIQNYHIKQSMVFDRDSEYTITAKPRLTYVSSVAKRSDGTVVEYNEADTHKLVSITDSDYATLTTKDSNTLYCIPE